MMTAIVMSPRGWWRRHPLPDAGVVPDSQLAFGGLIAFTFILLLAPQMMVPALAVLAFIRPALIGRLGGGGVVPLQSHAHEAAAHGLHPRAVARGRAPRVGQHHDSRCPTGRGEASPSSPASS